MQSERSFRQKTYKAIDALPNTYRESVQQIALRGSPDLFLCINGHFVALEYKRSSSAATAELQRYKQKKIKAAGGMAYMVNPTNWQQIYNILKSLSNN